jgi:hypothetical protein
VSSGRLVFATQVVDPDDLVLGATVAKLRALAARLDEVVVLADRAVELAVTAALLAVVLCTVYILDPDAIKLTGRGVSNSKGILFGIL